MALELKLEKMQEKIDSDFENYRAGYKVYSLKEEIGEPLEDSDLSEIINYVSNKYQCSCESISGDKSSFSSNNYLLLFKK